MYVWNGSSAPLVMPCDPLPWTRARCPRDLTSVSAPPGLLCEREDVLGLAQHVGDAFLHLRGHLSIRGPQRVLTSVRLYHPPGGHLLLCLRDADIHEKVRVAGWGLTFLHFLSQGLPHTHAAPPFPSGHPCFGTACQALTRIDSDPSF